MATYEREVWVDAPFDRVWAFHATADGLSAVTPDWLRLRVEAVRGPDGEPTDELVPGTTVRLSVRPFGLGPRRRSTSRITARERSATVGRFTDEMVDGPVPRWVHTHRFRAVDGGTHVSDRVEYRLPLGPLSGLSPLGAVGLEPLFRYRHRRTRELLEGDETGACC